MSRQVSMIERRRIEAEILKEVYEVLRSRYGAESAQRDIADAVRQSSINQARNLAATIPSGPSLNAFAEILPLWTVDDALEIEELHRSDTDFHFNVRRCRYAEMYREMGIAELGKLLSCNRDGAFCEGFDPNIEMTRTQTIMEGASHCDFRYRSDPDKRSRS